MAIPRATRPPRRSARTTEPSRMGVPSERGRWTSTRLLSATPHRAATVYLPAGSDDGRWRLTWNAPSGPAVVVPVTEPGRPTVVGTPGEQPVPETLSVWPALR